jgi:DNA repair protein RecO (recombination protein O)
VSADDAVAGVALGGAWRLVAELGFAPSLEECASCHAPLAGTLPVVFNHRAGGALCERCARLSQGGRKLPADARRALGAWLAGERDDPADAASVKAHQRLLREFLEEHLGDGQPLRAFVTWEEQLQAPTAAAHR